MWRLLSTLMTSSGDLMLQIPGNYGQAWESGNLYNSLVFKKNGKWGWVDYGLKWPHAANGKSTAPFQVASNANRTMTLARRETQVKEGQVWRGKGRHARCLVGPSEKDGRIRERLEKLDEEREIIWTGKSTGKKNNWEKWNKKTYMELGELERDGSRPRTGNCKENMSRAGRRLKNGDSGKEVWTEKMYSWRITE